MHHCCVRNCDKHSLFTESCHTCAAGTHALYVPSVCCVNHHQLHRWRLWSPGPAKPMDRRPAVSESASCNEKSPSPVQSFASLSPNPGEKKKLHHKHQITSTKVPDLGKSKSKHPSNLWHFKRTLCCWIDWLHMDITDITTWHKSLATGTSAAQCLKSSLVSTSVLKADELATISLNASLGYPPSWPWVWKENKFHLQSHRHWHLLEIIYQDHTATPLQAVWVLQYSSR